MEKYKDMTIKKKSNLKMLRNLIFFILLIVFTFWFIFKDQDINEIFKAIRNVNLIYVLMGLICMFFTYIIESYNVRNILVSLGEKKLSIIKALKFTWIGFFFSAITPAASGGQPVEIYYMTKDKISSANGTMAMLLQLCSFQIATILISIISVIINPNILRNGMIWFYLLGVLLNGIVLSFMLVAIFSKKITKKLVNIFIKIIKTLKVKNIEIKKKKILESLNQYNESAKFIKKNKTEFIKSILRVLVQVICFHSIPFFTYKAFGLSGYSYIELLTIQSVFFISVSSLPLPGAVGISETLFLKIFGRVFGRKILNGAMLINRFISFYFYVLLSMIVVIINAIKNKNVVSEIDKNIKEIDGV